MAVASLPVMRRLPCRHLHQTGPPRLSAAHRLACEDL